uniref:Uncharacterized protein n=2 Tax=Rhizophagus irregularis TaxID=588596 RepID=U9TWW9_RHIID
MSAVKREEYFKETEPSEWSLVSFLSWRSKQHEVLQMSLEYSTWKSFIENIVNNSQLQYIVILHRERLKNWYFRLRALTALPESYNNKNLELKYIIDKSEAATTHSALMGERRSQILESELKHKRKDFFQSPAEVSTNLASYAHLQKLLNEGVQLPASYKQKNEVRENASTCKKTKKRVKITMKTNYSGEKFSSKFPFSSNEEDEEITVK